MSDMTNNNHRILPCGYCAASDGENHTVACHESRGIDVVAEAEVGGREAGEVAATWVEFHDQHHAENIAMMLQDGDPRVYDKWREPNLSGEYADDPTPTTLAHDLGIPADDEALDDICTAWETAASEAFWHTVERDAWRIVMANQLEAMTKQRRDADTNWRQAIVEASTLADMSQSAIATLASITQQRVSQILNQCQRCERGKLAPVYEGATNRQCDYCWSVFTPNGDLVTT